MGKDFRDTVLHDIRLLQGEFRYLGLQPLQSGSLGIILRQGTVGLTVSVHPHIGDAHLVGHESLPQQLQQVKVHREATNLEEVLHGVVLVGHLQPPDGEVGVQDAQVQVGDVHLGPEDRLHH